MTVTAVAATLAAAASAPAGAPIEIGWTGPNYDGDYIGIGRVGATGSGRWETFAYTENGAPAQLRVPPGPGTYEIAYFLAPDRFAVTTAPFTVAQVTATLTAPATARAGETIEVAWTGPGYEGDYIGVGLVGATGSGQWRSFAYAKDAPVVQIELRDDLAPGAYQITYFMDLKRTRVASVPIQIVE